MKVKVKMKLRILLNKIVADYYRKKVIKTAQECGTDLYLGGKSFVTPNTFLADHVSFNGMSMYGNGKITIGKYFHSGINCQIITSFHNYNSNKSIPYDDTFIDKNVSIGDCVWLGNNVIILGGVTIGKGAIIQAGSVVIKDIPDYAVAGGHPAKTFKFRDIEEYKKLEKEGKFF